MMDAQRTGLVRRGVLAGDAPKLGAYNTYDFMEYTKLEDKLFPRRMLVLSQKVPTVDVFVEDIQYTKPLDSTHESAVPDGASLAPACTVDDAEVGKLALLASIPPQFEATMSRFIHFGGAARVYGVVGTDGNIGSVTLILSDTKLPGQSNDFADVAKQIVQTMKYKPYLCAGTPQAFGTEEEIVLRGTIGGP